MTRRDLIRRAGRLTLFAFVQSWLIPFARWGSDAQASGVSIEAYGAVSGGADCTAAIADCLAANNTIMIPAGTWHVDTIAITTAGKTVQTAGLSTIIQQRPGNVGTRLIEIAASNTTLETLTVKGNISTDTDEQNHGVFVFKTGGSISNISIGDIYGENLRGDVLYVGCPIGHLTSYVTVGTITGKNILRNVVSITGGEHITGTAAVTDASTGYATLDIEPNDVAVTDVTWGSITGAVFQCAPPTAATTARRITVGTVTLNPSLASNSTPAYEFYDVSNAVKLRNTIGITIGSLSITGHAGLGVTYDWNSGESRGSAIVIQRLTASGVGYGEITYNALCNFSNVDDFEINGGTVALDGASDAVVLGDSSGAMRTSGRVTNLTCNGRVANFIARGFFRSVTSVSTSPVSAFKSCLACTLLYCRITVPTGINFSNFITVRESVFSCSTANVGASSSNIQFIEFQPRATRT